MVVLALSVELHLPDLPVPQGPAGGGAPDSRRRPAPLPDQRRRGRLPGASGSGPGSGFAVVAPSEGQATEVMDDVERFVWSFPEVEVGRTERHWLDADAD